MNFLRNASLRSRLLVLGIVAILPIALLSIGNLVYIAEGRQAELERSAMDTVRALSIAVDKEISTNTPRGRDPAGRDDGLRLARRPGAARAAGFDEHIVKPVEEAELMRAIAGSARAAEGA